MKQYKREKRKKNERAGEKGYMEREKRESSKWRYEDERKGKGGKEEHQKKLKREE